MSEVIDLSEVRKRRRNALGTVPAWSDDISTCCAYARMMKAEHQLERERLSFEQLKDEFPLAWWDWPEDRKQRVHANNHLWDTYIAFLHHIAKLPAGTRREASIKRNTIGKMWLAPDVLCESLFGQMREGCLRDDHLFPPSMKLARAVVTKRQISPAAQRAQQSDG